MQNVAAQSPALGLRRHNSVCLSVRRATRTVRCRDAHVRTYALIFDPLGKQTKHASAAHDGALHRGAANAGDVTPRALNASTAGDWVRTAGPDAVADPYAVRPHDVLLVGYADNSFEHCGDAELPRYPALMMEAAEEAAAAAGSRRVAEAPASAATAPAVARSETPRAMSPPPAQPYSTRGPSAYPGHSGYQGGPGYQGGYQGGPGYQGGYQGAPGGSYSAPPPYPGHSGYQGGGYQGGYQGHAGGSYAPEPLGPGPQQPHAHPGVPAPRGINPHEAGAPWPHAQPPSPSSPPLTPRPEPPSARLRPGDPSHPPSLDPKDFSFPYNVMQIDNGVDRGDRLPYYGTDPRDRVSYYGADGGTAYYGNDRTSSSYYAGASSAQTYTRPVAGPQYPGQMYPGPPGGGYPPGPQQQQQYGAPPPGYQGGYGYGAPPGGGYAPGPPQYAQTPPPQYQYQQPPPQPSQYGYPSGPPPGPPPQYAGSQYSYSQQQQPPPQQQYMGPPPRGAPQGRGGYAPYSQDPSAGSYYNAPPPPPPAEPPAGQYYSYPNSSATYGSYLEYEDLQGPPPARAQPPRRGGNPPPPPPAYQPYPPEASYYSRPGGANQPEYAPQAPPAEATYPGIELLSPGYPEFEKRQSGGGSDGGYGGESYYGSQSSSVRPSAADPYGYGRGAYAPARMRPQSSTEYFKDGDDRIAGVTGRDGAMREGGFTRGYAENTYSAFQSVPGGLHYRSYVRPTGDGEEGARAALRGTHGGLTVGVLPAPAPADEGVAGSGGAVVHVDGAPLGVVLLLTAMCCLLVARHGVEASGGRAGAGSSSGAKGATV